MKNFDKITKKSHTKTNEQLEQKEKSKRLQERRKQGLQCKRYSYACALSVTEY